MLQQALGVLRELDVRVPEAGVLRGILLLEGIGNEGDFDGEDGALGLPVLHPDFAAVAVHDGPAQGQAQAQAAQ